MYGVKTIYCLTKFFTDTDASPSAATFKPIGEMFDLLFEFPQELGDGEYAAVTDGEYIYNAHWNDDTFER